MQEVTRILKWLMIYEKSESENRMNDKRTIRKLKLATSNVISIKDNNKNNFVHHEL